MRLAEKPERCAGCTACASICPTRAVQMQEDEHGFVYPVIDENQCISCHQCERACFYVSGIPAGEECFSQECYASWCADIGERQMSQSGGIGAVLASYILQKGGVVYGAAFDDQFVVRHQRFTTAESAQALRGAKYVQSSLEGVFQQIKTDVLGRGTFFLSELPARSPA